LLADAFDAVVAADLFGTVAGAAQEMLSMTFEFL